MKKRLFSVIIVVSMLFTFTSCDLFHQHSWQTYLSNNPTCTQKGLIKLYVTYSTGEELFASTFYDNNEIGIIGFGVNIENELVIYYSDNTIAFAGTISS